jgi:hypothetical protein
MPAVELHAGFSRQGLAIKLERAIKNDISLEDSIQKAAGAMAGVKLGRL